LIEAILFPYYIVRFKQFPFHSVSQAYPRFHTT